MSNSLQSHGLQHTRLPSPSPTPRAYSNSCPLSQWCHPTISFSVVPFFSHLQSFLTSGSFQMSQFFASGGQSIGVSASTPVLPMNTQDWSPLGGIGWISLLSKGLSRVFSNTTLVKHNYTLFFLCFPSFLPSRNNAMATLFWLCSCCLKKSYLQDAALLGFSIQHKVRQFFPQDGFDCISSV